MSTDIKKELLTRLREDEEFRYAVAGLIGLEDLRAGQARLQASQSRLEEAVARLAEAQARTEVALKELAIQVGRLSDVVGFSLEDIARVVLPGWLHRHEGIEVEELSRRFIRLDTGEVEVNLYGEGTRNGKKVIVLGESRSRIYERDVQEFDTKVEGVARTFKDEVYKLMFGFLIHPSAEVEAQRRGVKLVASYMR
jgi:hypothetical protein